LKTIKALQRVLPRREIAAEPQQIYAQTALKFFVTGGDYNVLRSNKHRRNRSMKNDKNKQRKKKDESVAGGIHIDGDFINPNMCSAAEIHPSAFYQQIPDDKLPGAWLERAAMAWKHYREEPFVNNIINLWRVFAIGDEIQIISDDKAVQSEASDFADKMKLNKLVKDMILLLLVKGECAAVKLRDRESGALEKIVCVNPNSVEVKYEGGKLVEMKQYPDRSGSEPITFAPDQMFHLRRNVSRDDDRGDSMVVAAFKSVELMKDLRKAERAAAKRLASPMRFIKVGGQFGNKVIIPDQKTLNSIRDMLNRMNPGAGLVVPFYVTVDTKGAEEIFPQIERLAGEIKAEICIALGVPKSVVTGEDANLATTKIALKKVVVQLKELKQAARDILNWVFDEWLEHEGREDKTISYIFSDLDLTDEIGIKLLYLALYDRGVVSRETMQLKMGFNPKVENAQMEKEKEKEASLGLRDKDAKTIVDLVNNGVITVEQARELFGLDEEGKPQKK